jgi:hypothetical protein
VDIEDLGILVNGGDIGIAIDSLFMNLIVEATQELSCHTVVRKLPIVHRHHVHGGLLRHLIQRDKTVLISGLDLLQGLKVQLLRSCCALNVWLGTLRSCLGPGEEEEKGRVKVWTGRSFGKEQLSRGEEDYA